MDMVSALATESIIGRKAVISRSCVERVGSLLNLEASVSLAEAEAALGGHHKADFGIEVCEEELAVGGGNERLLRVDIGEAEGKGTRCVVSEANLLEAGLDL